MSYLAGKETVVPGPKRVIAIGDIHGMADALRALIFRIDPHEDDQFVFLGDYIDRGPDSKGVIDQLIELAGEYDCRFILGNHEEFVLAATQGASEFNYWLKFGGREALRSYGLVAPHRASSPFVLQQLPPEHLRFLGSLENYVETDDAIFVHAGLNPELPMVEQVSDVLRWVTPREDLRHPSGKPIVCGHSPHARAVKIGGTWHVDTGAGVREDGKLSAVDVKSGQIWQVPAGRPGS